MKNYDKSLPERVVRLLIEKGWKISSAESCTGGLFAKLITDIPGSSAVLDESYVTYANAAKTKLLGVKEETLNTVGAVSRETVFEMASGLYKVTGAEVCVVFSGIAGPGGGTPQKPVGTVFAAVGILGEIEVFKFSLSGDRDEIRHSACYEMLEKITQRI